MNPRTPVTSASNASVIYTTSLYPFVIGDAHQVVVLGSTPLSTSTTSILRPPALTPISPGSDNRHGSSCLTDASSPICGTDQSSDLGLHPIQWAERARAIQLASSPDRPPSRPTSPLSSSSPLRSSPIIFSSPPPPLRGRASLAPKRYLHHHQENSPPSTGSSSGNTPTTSSAASKRGRPSRDEIPELILNGSHSRWNIKCDICHRVFPRDKSLQAHLRTHTGERPFKCNYPGCTRAFAQSGQLRTHQRLHTGEKPFICQAAGCDSRFTHPNRKCTFHPQAGLRRVIPVIPPKKRGVHSQHLTQQKPEESISTPSSSSSASSQPTSSSTSCSVLKNITSTVVNSPKISIATIAPSQRSGHQTSANQPVVARKSVIVGRSVRKLDVELHNAAQDSNPSSYQATLTTTSTLTTASTQQQQQQQQQQENSMEMLGALALMELSKGSNNKKSGSSAQGSENRAPERTSGVRSSPRKLRLFL